MLTSQDIKEILTSLGRTIKRIAMVFNESEGLMNIPQYLVQYL